MLYSLRPSRYALFARNSQLATRNPKLVTLNPQSLHLYLVAGDAEDTDRIVRIAKNGELSVTKSRVTGWYCEAVR